MRRWVLDGNGVTIVSRLCLSTCDKFVVDLQQTGRQQTVMPWERILVYQLDNNALQDVNKLVGTWKFLAVQMEGIYLFTSH